MIKRDEKILYSVKSFHPFSTLDKSDKFLLLLTGKSIIKGKVTFQIFNSNNLLIHNELFPSTDLLLDEADVITNVIAQRDSIQIRLKNFFSKENFIKPAISICPRFDPDNSDKKIWTEIKTNKTAIGFVYSHGYEGTYAIAYSKKSKKAVCYFSSD